MIVNKSNVRPTEDMLNKAWDRNPDGVGIAWREKGEVYWKKALKLDETKEMVASLPVPFIVHFRRASPNGGGIFPELTHPFPINAFASTALEGHTKDPVLFHNGNVKEWAYEVKHAALMTKTKIPTKKWSDTRGLAFLLSIYGHGYMDWLQDQRGVAFGPKGEFDVFSGPGWAKVEDVWCSNDQFWKLSTMKLCKNPKCSRTDSLDYEGMCPAHPLSRRVGNVSEPTPSSTGTKEVSPAQPIPFSRGILRTNEGRDYQGPLLGLAEAELMEKSGKISKNLLKAIRKAHFDLETGGKEGARAQRALAIVSHQVFSPGLRA